MRLRPTSFPTPAVQPELVHQSPAVLSSLGRTTRLHPASQIRKIKNSIGEFGFREPVLVDGEGRVIGGAARVQAARELGLPTIPTVVVRDLDPDNLRLLRLALIKSSEEAQWNFEILDLELSDLEISLPKIDLTISGFSRVEIEGIRFGKAARQAKDDAPPAPFADVVSSLGDLWRCGDHRVLCGDALETESYQELLGDGPADAAFLDTPYNCEVSGHVTSSCRHREFVMASGEMSDEEFRNFRAANLALVHAYSRPGAVVFSFIDWRGIETEIAAAREAGLKLLNVAAWVKSPGMGSYLRSAHELCVIAHKPGAAPRNNVQLGKNGRNRSNVWSYDGVGGFGAEKAKLREMHPTCKPTPLIRDALLDVTAPGEVVLDTFSGSGSTLIACEGIGRHARVMDLDAGYVDVTVRRWQAFTGRKATLIETGETFAEVCARRLADLRPPVRTRTRAPAGEGVANDE